MFKSKHSIIHITFLGDNKMKIKSSYDVSKKENVFEVKYDGYLKEIVQKLLEEKIE